jgi:hypothetical protein
MLRALVLMVLMLALAACAFAETAIYFDPEDGEVNAHSDTIYRTEVWIGPVDDIKGYSIEITFRPADLNLVEVVAGDIFSSAGHMSAFFEAVRPGAVEDTIAVDASDLTGSVAGPGHLFTICFGRPWVYVEHSPLTIIRTNARDSGNAAIPIVPVNGSVTISFPVGDAATTWGGIKGLYR